MIEMTPEEIKKKAQEYIKRNVRWHAHFLTPTCKLNDTKKYATLLECPAEGFVGAHFLDHEDKSLIGFLTPLLHGVSIVSKDSVGDSLGNANDINDDAHKIINRARELNEQDIIWHHHVLFPDCRFNKNQSNWTLIFEDPKSNTVLQATTDSEPKAALTLLEPLFYAR